MNRGNVGGLLGNAPGPPHIVGLPQPSLGPGVGDMVAQLGGMGGMPSNIIQSRDLLYRLIISQLFYDGYQQVAVTLSNIVHADPPCPPSDRYKYSGYPFLQCHSVRLDSVFLMHLALLDHSGWEGLFM